jgi:hypothetical protein
MTCETDSLVWRKNNFSSALTLLQSTLKIFVTWQSVGIPPHKNAISSAVDTSQVSYNSIHFHFSEFIHCQSGVSVRSHRCRAQLPHFQCQLQAQGFTCASEQWAISQGSHNYLLEYN